MLKNMQMLKQIAVISANQRRARRCRVHVRRVCCSSHCIKWCCGVL